MIFDGLTPGSYGVILADPPWSFAVRSPKGHGKSPERHYDTMSLDDIKALPVASLAAPNCALVMWATAPLLDRAIEVLAAWGFQYKSAGAWAKMTSGGKWQFGIGYLYRSAAEFWFLGTRGRPKPLVRNIRNLIAAPVREHSRKPDEMHAQLERHFPGPRCELFARERRPGWDCWGNQVEKFKNQEKVESVDEA